MTGFRRILLPAAAVLAVGYLAVMAAIGAAPVQRQLVRAEARGVLGLQAEAVRRVDVAARGATVTLLRHGEKAWSTVDGAVAPSASAQLDTALKVLHRSGPVREIDGDDLAGVDTRPFGLDAPVVTVSVYGAAADPVLTARFGALNPEGILQYMRLDGSDRLYLMSRFVAAEWLTALDEVAGR